MNSYLKNHSFPERQEALSSSFVMSIIQVRQQRLVDGQTAILQAPYASTG